VTSYGMDPGMHMWFVLALTLLALISYVREKISIEITSVLLVTTLLVFGQLFPLRDASGANQLDAMALLSGFANPSLVAVLALLVMGQGMIHTDAIRVVTQLFRASDKKTAWMAIIGILVFVMVFSGFMNNTPLVVIAIPVVQALAQSAGLSDSRIMIPLSYVAILGGMTTLVGSSTNLLVSSAMVELGYPALQFFDFVVPGAILAAVGFLYVILFVPHLLSERRSMARDLAGGNSKEFVAEVNVNESSRLVGQECENGHFPALGGLNVKLIHRGAQLILPPFEGYTIQAGDNLILAASREDLISTLSKFPGFLLTEEDREREILDEAKRIERRDDEKEDKEAEKTAKPEMQSHILAEIMIPPASRMIDMTIEHINFPRQFGLIVLGIQRRARVVRRRLSRIRLEPGDTLLVGGKRDALYALRNNPDMVVLSGSKQEVPVPAKAPIAGTIFLGVILSAALGIMSIPVAAVTGAVLMVATGCLNMRQAMRSIDRTIFFLVGSMLALGVAMQETGGARFIAGMIVDLPFSHDPLAMAGLLFIIVAVFTNLLSNNACAILFTPIALNIAGNVTVPPGFEYDMAFVFAVTVVFAANCSFASPIGYKTNLLVMGPGHYRFRDFAKAGLPIVMLLWMTYVFIAKYYYGL